MYEVLARHIGGISSYDLEHTHCAAYVRSLSVVRKRFNEVSLSRAMTALFVGKIISFLDEPPPPRPTGAAIATPVAELRAAPTRWRGSRLSSTSHHHL